MLISPARLLLPLIATTVVACSSPSGLRLERYEYAQIIMGGEARIILYATDEAKAREAARAAFDRMDDLEAVMSDYRADSELMRLCDAGTTGPVPVSDDLLRVLELSREISAASDGAFDVTVGPVVELWRTSRDEGRLPDPGVLSDARSRTGWRAVRLDPAASTVALQRPGMQLDLGGIGKGFAADEALAVLYDHGVGRCLVNLAGDIAVGRAPPGSTGWRIRVPALREDSEPRTLILSDAGIATSGDAERYVMIEGVRYSHIVDPRTGLGLTDSAAVTVIARRAATADALASAISVMGEAGASRVLTRFPDASAIVQSP